MLTQSVLSKADAYWARDFGRWPVDLRPASTRVQIHSGELIGNDGIWILAVGAHPLISVPQEWMPSFSAKASVWTREFVKDPGAIHQALAPLRISRLIGPAFIGYVTPETLNASWPSPVRMLTDRDRAYVESLRGACEPEDWKDGVSLRDDVAAFGAFDEAGVLCAMASYEIWNRRLAHLYVVSSPRQRGRGYATAAVAMAAQAALEADLVPQYRTLMSNGPSMQVARKLGFEEYGFSIYLKIEK